MLSPQEEEDLDAYLETSQIDDDGHDLQELAAFVDGMEYDLSFSFLFLLSN
jgi:hypothetical protein